MQNNTLLEKSAFKKEKCIIIMHGNLCDKQPITSPLFENPILYPLLLLTIQYLTLVSILLLHLIHPRKKPTTWIAPASLKVEINHTPNKIK
jgi:hypothetical protein